MHSGPRKIKEEELSAPQWVCACRKQRLCHSRKLTSRSQNTNLFSFPANVWSARAQQGTNLQEACAHPRTPIRHLHAKVDATETELQDFVQQNMQCGINHALRKRGASSALAPEQHTVLCIALNYFASGRLC